MPDVEIALTEKEHLRLCRAAQAQGKTVDQLVADELRERFALSSSHGDVLTLNRARRDGDRDD